MKQNEKIVISQNKLDINLQFYVFLKTIVKLKPVKTKILKIFELHNLFLKNKTSFINKIQELFTSKQDIQNLEMIIERLNSDIDIELFIFSLRLYEIKDLLLNESKIQKDINIEKLKHINPLSIEYDKISVCKPYTTRVYGAILTLMFFEKLQQGDVNFMSQDACEMLASMATEMCKFKKLGLETNQIFMLIFIECLNQSIISDSGVDYETRILSILTKLGIKNISKEHDTADASMEFDFFFEFNNKTFGIGAKRTLRERYKQFIHTSISSDIDIMIEITLGIDLNEDKANIITNQYKTYIFVADEIYSNKSYLQNNPMIFSVKDLNIKTLTELSNINK